MAGEIVRRCAGDEGQAAQAAGDERRVVKGAAANDAVDAVTQQVDGPVAYADVQLQFGIAFLKVRQCGKDQHRCHGRSHVHAQPSMRARLSAGQIRFGFKPLIHHPHHAFVVSGAVVGQRDAPRGAVEQLDTQVALQRLNVFGNGVARKIQRLCGFDEAPPACTTWMNALTAVK